MTSNLKFPIGEFEKPDSITKQHIENWIITIEAFPKQVSGLANNCSEEELSRTYRPDGWTAAQVIHHCADSHMNSLIRFKLALTEDCPTIRPYYEDRWANLPDYSVENIHQSLKLLEVLHAKWVVLLRSLTEDELKRDFIHPDSGQKITLAENIGIYAWHCEHHLAHMRIALANESSLS